MAQVLNIDGKNFEGVVIKAKSPVMVDFWAPWCAPCLAMGPIFEEMAEEYGERVAFTRLNVDNAPQLASRYNILGIPTILLFKEGKPFKQIVGLRPKRELKREIDEALK